MWLGAFVVSSGGHMLPALMLGAVSYFIHALWPVDHAHDPNHKKAATRLSTCLAVAGVGTMVTIFLTMQETARVQAAAAYIFGVVKPQMFFLGIIAYAIAVTVVGYFLPKGISALAQGFGKAIKDMSSSTMLVFLAFVGLATFIFFVLPNFPEGSKEREELLVLAFMLVIGPFIILATFGSIWKALVGKKVGGGGGGHGHN